MLLPLRQSQVPLVHRSLECSFVLDPHKSLQFEELKGLSQLIARLHVWGYDYFHILSTLQKITSNRIKVLISKLFLNIHLCPNGSILACFNSGTKFKYECIAAKTILGSLYVTN